MGGANVIQGKANGLAGWELRPRGSALMEQNGANADAGMGKLKGSETCAGVFPELVIGLWGRVESPCGEGGQDRGYGCCKEEHFRKFAKIRLPLPKFAQPTPYYKGHITP